MKKALILAVVLAVCCTVCAACQKSSSSEVMSIEGGKGLTINYVYLLTSVQKTIYSSVISEYGNDWNAVANAQTGETFGDMLRKMTYNYAKSSLVSEYLFDKVFNLNFTEEDAKSLEEQISALEANAGSRRNLEEQLSTYGADMDSLQRYLEISIKQSKIIDYLYGENGTVVIPEDDIKEFFADNYAIVTHIYFNVPATQKEDGTFVSPPKEEKEAKKLIADEVYARLIAGEDFYALKEEFNEDVYESSYYPDGFFVTNDDTFPAEFTSAAMEMDEGEYRMAETNNENGYSIHIIHKLPMKEELYNTNLQVYQNIYSMLEADNFQQLIGSYSDFITADEKALSEIDVNIVPAFGI
jgi:hypothetical protein